jgi:tripartite-type tricarboxylate transporter receptor subunit TctC
MKKILFVSLLSLLFFSTRSLHAAYPDKPIHIVVPFAPGGATDLAARIIAPALQVRLGQSVIIDNKAGAGATIGTAAVSMAPPDGYTLLLGSAANAIGNAISNYSQKKMPYLFERDFIPVALVAEVPGVLIVPTSFAVQNLTQLIAYAKTHPGQLSYGSPGFGTSVHLAGELFESMADVQLVHVPYKGASPAMTDLLGQRIQLMFPALSVAQPYIESGKVRALAVTTRQRSTLAPNIPTMQEAGLPGYEVSGWLGIFAPKGVSPENILILEKAMISTLKDPQVQLGLSKISIEATPGSAKVLNEKLETDTERWNKLIKNKKLDLQ